MLKDQPTDTDRPTVDESYTAAGGSGNMSRAGADLLLASGMSGSIAGGVFMRLMGEWDAAVKSRTGGHFDTRELAQSMRSLPGALVQIGAIAAAHGVNQAAAPEVLHWWLNPCCIYCQGHGSARVPGLPIRSLRRCSACNGSKTRPIPYGSAGKRLVAGVDEAVNAWRSLTAKKLRAM